MKHARLLAVALLFAVCAAFGQEAADGQEDERLEATPQARQKWFYDQRAYPAKQTPPGAHRKAFQQLMTLQIAEEAARVNAPTKNVVTPLTWSLVGPRPSDQSGFGYGLTSGRVTALAVDQTTSGASTVIYLGGAEGGVWKSSNAGTTWTPLTDKQPTLAIGSIAIDPNNHNIIYAGTGEQNYSGDSYYGGGVLKSTNGGSTWTMMGASYFGGTTGTDSYYGGGSYIGSVAVEPGVSSGTPVILVGAQFSQGSGYPGNSGIWRSTDGGTTWSLVYPGSPNAYSIPSKVVWVDTNTAYASFGSVFGPSGPQGMYISTNKGVTWTPANGSAGHLFPTVAEAGGRIEFAVAPSNHSVIYATIQDANTYGLYGMYKTVDGGTNWDPLPHTPLNTTTGSTSDFCGGQCWYDMPIAVSPTNSNVVYVGGSLNYGAGNGGVYVTLDGGSTWSTPNPGTNSVRMHPDFHAFAFSSDGNTLFIGEDGGVWSGTPTNSATMALTDLNTGLAITEFYPGLSISAASKTVSLNGTQDNGTQLYSGALQWKVVACGDGAWTAIDPSNAMTMYTGCTRANSGPYRSTNGGSSWTLISTGLNQTNAGFIPPMIMDPNNSTTLYYGTPYLWKMTNANVGSPSWALVNGSALTSQHITAIAVTPGNSNNIFTGASDGVVEYSTNAGTSFTQMTSILPNRYVTWVEADPAVATTFYVTFSGFSGYTDTVGHVFKCSTASASCTDMSGDLPNTPANAIVVDPDSANTYYVATDIGVFYTSNGGTHWSTAGAGLPNVAVVGLKLHEASRTLRAATHGRSSWDLPVPAGAPATITSPVSGTTLAGALATFSWTAGTNVTAYDLYVGTTPGAHDIASVSTGLTRSATVTNIPTNGATVYVTLYSKINGYWTPSTATYKEYSGSKGVINSPVNGSVLGASQTFTWTGGSNVSTYILYLGTTAGAHDILSANTGTGTSYTAASLPINGSKVYATLYSRIGNTYQSSSDVYTASTNTPPAMQTPAPGSTLSGSTVTFTWTTGTANAFTVYFGTTQGAHDIGSKSSSTGPSVTMTGLPTGGGTLYVRLYYRYGTSLLFYKDYTYTEAP